MNFKRREGRKVKLFTYKAKDSKGNMYKGSLQAEDSEAFFNYLQQKQIYCLSYRETNHKTFIKEYRISVKQLTIFCRQLAIMLGSDIPLIKCIYILYQQEKEFKFKNILQNVYEDLQKGIEFSRSLKLQKRAFPNLLISMIRCGEESGTLDLILERMAKHYESENKLQNKVKNAMAYPIILGVISFLVILILLLLVVPTFVEMFADYGELPFSTQLLMAISNGIENYWGVILLINVILLGTFSLLFKIKSFKQWIDQMKLTLPIIGRLNIIILSARFAETTATLYASGMSLISILDTVQGIMNNMYIHSKLNHVKQEVTKGVALSNAIRQVDVFPLMLSSVILIGEESGSLEKALYKAAAFYHEEAESAVQKMVTLLEPSMIMILGIIVATIISAILPPMYEMMGSIG